MVMSMVQGTLCGKYWTTSSLLNVQLDPTKVIHSWYPGFLSSQKTKQYRFSLSESNFPWKSVLPSQAIRVRAKLWTELEFTWKINSSHMDSCMLPSPDVDPPKVSQSMFQMLLTKPRILPQQEKNLTYLYVQSQKRSLWEIWSIKRPYLSHLNPM